MQTFYKTHPIDGSHNTYRQLAKANPPTLSFYPACGGAGVHEGIHGSQTADERLGSRRAPSTSSSSQFVSASVEGAVTSSSSSGRAGCRGGDEAIGSGQGRLIWGPGLEDAPTRPSRKRSPIDEVAKDLYIIAREYKRNADIGRGVNEARVASLVSQLTSECSGCDTQSLANAVWALARLLRKDEGLLGALAAEAIRKVSTFKPLELAMTAWSRAALRAHDPVLLDAIFTAAELRLHEAGTQTLSNLAWSMAKLAAPHHPLLVALVGLSRLMADNFKSQELVNTAWSFARLSMFNLGFFLNAAAVVLRRKSDLNPQEVANFIWACATVSFSDERVILPLAAEAVGTLVRATPQEIANTIWSCARCSCKYDPLFHAVASVALARAVTFDPQSMVNIAWAMASCVVMHVPFFDMVSEFSCGRIDKFNVQDLANTAWCFARMAALKPQLATQLGMACATKTHRFDGQAVSSIAWAFAHAKYLDTPLFAALTKRAATNATEFDDQSLSLTVWALATLMVSKDTKDFDFTFSLQAIAIESTRKIDTFKVQHLANTAWAFAKLAFINDGLFLAIATESAKRVAELDCQAIANLLWSFASLARPNVPLFRALSSVTMARCSELLPQEISNIAWSFAREKLHDHPLLHKLMVRGMECLPELSTQHLSNISWAFIVLGEEYCLQTFLPRAAEAFLLGGASTGTEWVDFISAAVAILQPSTLLSQLEAHFEHLVLEPALRRLSAVAGSCVDEKDDSAGKEEALQDLQAFVNQIQLPHLGPRFTLDALGPRGLRCSLRVALRLSRRGVLVVGGADEAPPFWAVRARMESRAQRGGLLTFDAPPAVRADSIMAWASASFRLASNEKITTLGSSEFLSQELERGRLFRFGLSQEPGFADALQRLRPIFRHHERDTHAERVASAWILTGAQSICNTAVTPLQDIVGIVRIYASHFPCISCLAVLAQLARLLPKVEMEVAFEDAWATQS